MREAVRRAVQSCQYDDPQKKERLCSAVMEALTGRKTMKAAAAMHEVPFTTLQTYFHRSKAQLQREAAMEKVYAKQKTNRLSSEEKETELSVDTNGHCSHISERQTGKMDAGGLWSRLRRQQEEKLKQETLDETGMDTDSGSGEESLGELAAQEAIYSDVGDSVMSDADNQTLDLSMKEEDAEGTSTSSLSPAPALQASAAAAALSGSRKRKPQKIFHHTSSSTGTEPSESGVVGMEASSSWLEEEENNLFGADNRQVSDYLRGLMHIMTSSGELGEELSESVPVVEPVAPEDDQLLNLQFEDKQMEDLRKELLEQTGEKKASSLSPLDAVIRAIKNSQYDGLDRDRLREAVLKAVTGESSMKESSRMFSIPLGTFHTYYHRARNLLEASQAGLDPDSPAVVALINSLGAVSSNGKSKKKKKKKEEDGTSVKETPTMVEAVPRATDDEVARVVGKVVKNSQYPPEQKLRLQRAVARVVRGDMTINAAANVYQLPSSTLHPYVHRTRAALGNSLPPQAKLTKVGMPFKSALRSPSKPKAVSPTMNLSLKVKESEEKTAKTETSSAMSEQALMESLQAVIDGAGHVDMTAKNTPSKQTEKPKKKLVLRNNSGLSLEEVDRTVSELVKVSLYGAEGRQRLYEAIIMVVTDSATVTEASRVYSIPPSTIQPYVQRAKVALNIPLSTATSSSNSGTPKTTQRKNAVPAPRIYATPGKEASEEEVKESVKTVVQNSVQSDDRRSRLHLAVLAAVSGKATIKDACTEQNLPASTVHPYVSRARHLLGDRCPPPKIATCAPATLGSLKNLYKDRPMPGRLEPLHGVLEEPPLSDLLPPAPRPVIPPSPKTKPQNVILYSGSLAEGQTGRKLLMIQLKQMLSRYNYRGDRERLVKGIAAVIGDKKSLADVSAHSGIAQTTLSTYVRIARHFVKDSPGKKKRPKQTVSEGKVKVEVKTEMKEMDEDSEGVDADSFKIGNLTEEKLMEGAEGRSKELAAVILKRGVADRKEKADKYRAILRHLASSLFRRSAQQQHQLIEATLEVLMNEKTTEEVVRSCPGLTEHVVIVHADRARAAFDLLDQPLDSLFSLVAAELDASGRALKTPEVPSDPKRAKKSSGSSSSVSPPTPTRTSRRLQEKAEARASSATQDLDAFDLDAVFPAQAEQAVVNFLRRLSITGFPISSDIILVLAEKLLHQCPEYSSGRWALSSSWVDKFRQKHQLSGQRTIS